MTSPAYETILAYHQGSKHHFDRYAPSPGTMDWANQPNPFRFYDGAEQIPLPLTRKDPDCPYDDLYLPPEGKGLPLQISTLGSFLALSLGLSAWKVAGGARRWSLRINPSSGNLHPTEGHLILPALTGLAGGVFHYSPFRHGLERRSGLPSGCWASVEPHFGGPGFLLALTSIFWRESWKYGERAYRYCALDAGHALAAISFAARLHRWQATCLTGAGDEQIETILGFPDMVWATGGAEIPELICWISTVSPEHPVSQRLPRNWDRHFVGASFAGVPNPLSRQAVKWPVIDAVAEAGRKPETRPNPIDNHLIISAPLPSEPVDASAAAILRRRRSAVSYNPGKSIAASVFFSIVSRTLFRLDAPPFGVGLSAPDVNLLIFVHRVDGLTPGLYFLGRALAAADRCRNAWRDGFLWTPSHSTLPLWLLKEMDVTFEAMKLSCHQEIAGNSAFAVAMIAPLKERLKQATHAYRRLYWECGMIGQVLYLEAEAHGIRGTGIGCFFDDPVHHLLGIKDDADQNLYHFTVGHPVEDIRLTTLPAYYHLNR
jgi:SagB-type dehydrogenase family enzyme